MITLREEKGTQLTHQEMDENFKSVMGGHNFLHIQDQKPQGTSGGTFTSGAWRTRDLNTVLTNTITGASLAANQITLPAGKYYVEALIPAFSQVSVLRSHRAIVYDVTNSTILVVGQNARSHHPNLSSGTTNACIGNIFSISSQTVLEVRHRCEDTANYANALGVPDNFTTEVYSDIRIWRVGEYVAP